MRHLPKKNQPIKQSARLVAAEILLEFFTRKKPIKPIFEYHTKRAALSSKDRGLAKELVFGVLRRKQELDFALQALSQTPLRKLDPFLYQVLVIGLYQLLFLERIPDSAAVNEAVASCKMKKDRPIPKRLFGFVNGVLRQAARKQKELLQEISIAEQGHSPRNHPLWMTERWQQRFGLEEMEQICTNNNQPPTLTLRFNQGKTTRVEFCKRLENAAIEWSTARFAPEALLLPEGADISKLPGYQEGAFQVQDQAAQLATLLLAPFNCNSLRVLDACAGLGGKTSHMLQLLMLDAEIHAVEPEPFRMDRLRQTIGLHERCKIQLHQLDLLSLSPEKGHLFDRILVDAPCSGTGVIGRNPDIRWSRSLSDIVDFQEKQLSLLNHAATLAAKGAIIVYATCSIEQEENEEVIGTFLQNHPEFKLTTAAPFLPREAHRFLRNNFFYPHPEKEIDGFFAARMQKTA